MGVCLLQQMQDLTDDETVNQLAFNEQWHYALDISDESDTAKYLCHKTLWNIRQMVTDQELDTVMFQKVTDKLADIFNVDPSKQRLDSVHIHSNMRHLGRIRIISNTIHKFLVNLKRQHKEIFDSLPQRISGYLPFRKGPFLFFDGQAIGLAKEAGHRLSRAF